MIAQELYVRENQRQQHVSEMRYITVTNCTTDNQCHFSSAGGTVGLGGNLTTTEAHSEARANRVRGCYSSRALRPSNTRHWLLRRIQARIITPWLISTSHQRHRPQIDR